MLQKEVADRLVAAADTDPYGFLSLYRQLYSNARILLKLGPKSFHPRPKVDSAVVVLDPKPRDYESDPQTLHDLGSASFRMRRKKLVNNLICGVAIITLTRRGISTRSTTRHMRRWSSGCSRCLAETSDSDHE